MKSTLGWIDFSSQDRERLKNILNLVADPGMVDELGIGSIRDSFSDSLFPGISTIQTRAKYFVIVPRIIRDYELMSEVQRRRVGGLARYLADQEDECARFLAKPFSRLPDNEKTGTGIIGISALTTGVVRKPSEIYWGGLRTFGIIRTRLSRAEFCRLQDRPVESLRATIAWTETEKGDDTDAEASASLVRIPTFTARWRENLSISLTREEAEFLLHQMDQPSLSGSLWAELLQNQSLRRLILLEGTSFNALPVLFKDKVPAAVSSLLQMGVDFWNLLEGAHIRYNCLLQKQFGTPELLATFEEQWQQWCKKVESFNWGKWNVSNLWGLAFHSGHNVREYTKIFIEQWCDEVRIGPTRQGAVERLDDLVKKQESINKRGKSRLNQNGISVREWIGISELNYRFPQVRRIIRDLQEGVDSNA